MPATPPRSNTQARPSPPSRASHRHFTPPLRHLSASRPPPGDTLHRGPWGHEALRRMLAAHCRLPTPARPYVPRVLPLRLHCKGSLIFHAGKRVVTQTHLSPSQALEGPRCGRLGSLVGGHYAHWGYPLECPKSRRGCRHRPLACSRSVFVLCCILSHRVYSLVRSTHHSRVLLAVPPTGLAIELFLVLLAMPPTIPVFSWPCHPLGVTSSRSSSEGRGCGESQHML